MENAEQAVNKMEQMLANDPEYQLPEPQGMISGKAYKKRFAEPVVSKLKYLAKALLVKYFKLPDRCHSLEQTNSRLYREKDTLGESNDRLMKETRFLRDKIQDYSLLRKVFGSTQNELLDKARSTQRGRNKSYSRPR